MDLEQIQNFEQRYQVLYSDFQAGKIDETTFIAEIDKLQFQDEWGRYWMMGTQTGSWHYYDGQNWHQADPRQADKLPFMDDHGRYWQRGVKSGDWYYYQAETGEWVKPGEGDDLARPAMQGMQPGQPAGYTPYHSQLQPQSIDAGPGLPHQLDGELYQDDEGRYWAIGAKSGQWYFYDQNGWHPAHEFQQQIAPRYAPQYQTQPVQSPYSPAQSYDWQPRQADPGHQQPAQSYVVQPTQPGYQQPTSPTQPIQIYITSPGQETQSAGGQPIPGGVTQPSQTAAQQPGTPHQPPSPQNYVTSSEQPKVTQQAAPADPLPQPVSAEPASGPMPKPPKDRSESGSWYYFDGEQWLKYSTGEPEAAPPPPPKMVIDQAAHPSTKPKAETKDEQPVVAEFIDDEPPVEVVDVEVITVIEAEPDPKPKPEEPEPASTEFAPPVDDFRPRRASRSAEIPRRAAREPIQPQSRRSRDRTPSEPRSVMPRKKETAHEPTLIIPTESTASQISAPALPTARAGRPSPGERRRAREDTRPIETLKDADAADVSSATHRGVTQAMPTTAGSAARNEKAQATAAKSARQSAQQKAETTAGKPEKTGFTVGDVFRSIPGTVWTFAGGVVLLLGCAFGLIFAWSWFQGGELSPGGLAAIPSLTPTLDAGPPDATPTPGPTVTSASELEVTATPASLAIYNNADLGFSVEYPETWETEDDELCAGFAPSTAGLDRDNPQDAGIWICNSADNDAEIADLLTEVLTDFPSDAETLNEGTISIASQTWTSAQIRYEAEDLGGQGIATLAVTNKDGMGYYLVALAPAEEWNAIQPLFQAMINSFSFSTQAIAQASLQAETDKEAPTTDEENGEKATPDSGSTRQKSTTEAAPEEAPVPKGTATPLVYAVQSGDTLLGIALKFGVDADLLAAKNDIDDPASLQVGQELVIPFTAAELEAFNAGQGGVAEVAPADAGEEPAAADDETEAPVAEAPALADAPKPDEAASTEAAVVSGRIVYPAFNPGTNVYDLWMADVATGEQTIIAAEASQPAFNRDGSLLAYRSWNLGTRGIFFRDFVGGRGGQVTRFVEDGLPTWSPDGYSFAFASRREGDRVPRIFVGNQLGEGDYGIGFQGEYPATFPDGRLVVKGCSPQGDCGLYVMGASGGGDTKISGADDTAPAVSPDGSKIAVMSSGRGATNWEIWVMNADGSNPQRLTQNGSNEGLPTWSPDGQSIAYVSDQGGVWAIWVMNADGSNQRKLFNMNGSPDGQVLHDINNSKGWVEERISWAP